MLFIRYKIQYLCNTVLPKGNLMSITVLFWLFGYYLNSPNVCSLGTVSKGSRKQKVPLQVVRPLRGGGGGGKGRTTKEKELFCNP